MAKYLRLTIDVRVENDEFAEQLLAQELDDEAYEFQKNVEAGEISIDGIWEREDHS